MASVHAQELYMPREIKKAFKKGTRSMDGNPGKNYWQNSARYDITINAAPPSRTIRGSESITYFNNSPDSLRTLVFKLLLNIHKAGAPRNGGAQPDYLTSGVHIDAYTVNGKTTPWRENPFLFTLQPVRLGSPLLPHDSVRFTVDWHYDVSLQSGREGMIDSTTYFLAYFYPRVGVYDDYQGWDRSFFMDDHEFYNDFNDYNVTINVPARYVVWGTGSLQKPETVLQKPALDRFMQSMTSDQTIHVATRQEISSGAIAMNNAVNSWQFRAKNISDMAFGLSDHFAWDAASVVVDDRTGRRAGVQAVFNDTAKDYHHMVEYGRHALSWLSHNWPGVPYPFEKTTVFQGFAGMEYPMMANDETYEDTIFSRFVAEHEIAHTYMPFYMGINETRYGFMDEGWATTFEILIGREDLGVEKAETFYKQFRVEGWINDPSSDEDIAIITPGDALNGGGFGNNEYGKASLGYLAMKDYLGDAMFKKCLQAYMDRWHGKHPLPWDFFFTFNQVSGKNLNWLWNNWFFSNNYIDLSINSSTKTALGYQLKIDNVGGMAAPVDVIVTYQDGTSEKFHQAPGIWEKNQKQALVNISTKKPVQSISLDGGIYMDADESNNIWKAKGF
jgi:hypothetical protein